MNAIQCIGARTCTARTAWRAALVAAVLLPAGGAAAEQPPKEDYSKEPGYVDFQGLGMFGEEDAVVEVYLHDALLHMVAQMSNFADPELSEMLAKLKLIRVQKFRLEEPELEQVEEKIAALSGKLESKGWMRAVRVREETDNVYVYFKFGGEKVQGITVMAVEGGETAAFVNIVGEIDPEQIGRLGRKFDIDELHDIHLGAPEAGKAPKAKKPRKTERPPEAPGTPEPEKPEKPEKPEAPEAPEASELSGMPQAPDLPETPR